jgi:phosphatidylglycerophosphate synthase
MALVAVVVSEANGGTPALVVGGISTVARQCREAHIAKAARVYVLTDGPIAGLENENVTLIDSPARLASEIAADDAVLVFAAGLIVDERIVAAVRAAPVPAVASWPTVEPPRGIERIDSSRLSAGVAVYRGATVCEVAAGLGDWDLASTLLRTTLADPAVTIVDVAALETYAPARRRHAPFIWAVPTDLTSARHATDIVVESAQKGCLDWPARLIHPPIEDALVRVLAPTRITPNMVTAFAFVLGIAAGVAFLFGWLWAGLAMVLIVGPLDGVDGKLARTTLNYSRFGDLEHVLDKICEYGWFLCIGSYLARFYDDAWPWGVAALLVLFALAESLQGEFFRRFTGKQLDDSGSFERRFRLISGRRNTFFWTLLPFGVAGAWGAGFITMSIYSALTFFVMQARMFIRLQQFGSAQSALIEANFARTAYNFLPAWLRSSR